MLYLHADPATLWERMRHSRNRPLLQTADPLRRLAELYAQRDALYREVADHVIESDRDEVMRFARAFEPELPRRRSHAMISDARRRARRARYPIHIGAGMLDRARRDRCAAVSRARGRRHQRHRRGALAGAGAAEPRGRGRRARDVVLIPDGEAHKNWATLHDVLTRLLEIARRALDRARRAGRRRRRRPRRLRRGDLPARHAVRAGADDAARAGRLVRRRQDRHQPSARQEHDRRVLPAARRADRHRLPRARCPSASSSAGLAEVIKYGAIRDAAFFAWLEANMDALLARDAEALRARDPRELPDQGRDRRRRTSASRASARCSISATRSATRSRRRRATARGCTAKRSRRAWCSRRSLSERAAGLPAADRARLEALVGPRAACRSRRRRCRSLAGAN